MDNIKCEACKYEIKDNTIKKCPRCGNIIAIKHSCENCKGCSLWKSCRIRN